MIDQCLKAQQGAAPVVTIESPPPDDLSWHSEPAEGLAISDIGIEGVIQLPPAPTPAEVWGGVDYNYGW